MRASMQVRIKCYVYIQTHAIYYEDRNTIDETALSHTSLNLPQEPPDTLHQVVQEQTQQHQHDHNRLSNRNDYQKRHRDWKTQLRNTARNFM